MDKKEILEKLESLPDSYWVERFKKIEQGRQDKIDDLLAELLYFFSVVMEDVLDLVSTYYAKNPEANDEYLALTRSEVNKIKNEIKVLQEKLKLENLEFDQDLQDWLEDLSTKTNRKDALELSILAYINYLYNLVSQHIYNLLEDVTGYYHASTVYEVFKAAGYGTKDIKKLTDDDLAILLAIIWRSTEETFDSVIWRYGRALSVELNQLVRRGRFMKKSLDELDTEIRKLFKSKLNELSNLVRTDATFYSTQGQEKAFDELLIEQAIFTAVLDERTSDMCREADGTVLAVDEITPWVNAPPLHYNCRSTLVPIVKRIDWLTGEIYETDETFDDWYQSF